MKTKKKVILFGLGRMGLRYLKIIDELNLNLVGIYDKNYNNAKKLLKKNNLYQGLLHKNLQSLLKKRTQIAIIASTADSHFELINLCSKNKIKKIMVEKPLASSLDECNKIKEISKRQKIKICVNHSNRFTNHFNYLKKTLNNKYFGKIKSINYLCGNIGLAMYGIHFFDFFNFLTNSEVMRVISFVKKDKLINPRGKKFKDFNGQVLVWNKQGIRGFMESSEDCGHGQTITCICELGIISIDLLSGQVNLNYRRKKYRSKKTSAYANPYVLNRKTIEIENIISSTKKNLTKFLNNRDYVQLDEGVYTLKVLISAINSSKNQNRVVYVNQLKDKTKFKWA